MLGLYLLAPWIAAYFKEPRLESIVCWLSLTCLLSAMTAPSSNLLRRQLNFRWLNIAQILSYAGLSVRGRAAGTDGRWRLDPGQRLAGAGTELARPDILPQSAYAASIAVVRGARRSTNTGSTVFITNLSNWFLNNLDRVFLGAYAQCACGGCVCSRL
jgi:PST family polysaccharide transporter